VNAVASVRRSSMQLELDDLSRPAVHALLDEHLRNMRQLETGSAPAFLAAQTLYASAGFNRCGAFGSYRQDPNSVFMSLRL